MVLHAIGCPGIRALRSISQPEHVNYACLRWSQGTHCDFRGYSLIAIVPFIAFVCAARIWVLCKNFLLFNFVIEKSSKLLGTANSDHHQIIHVLHLLVSPHRRNPLSVPSEQETKTRHFVSIHFSVVALLQRPAL